MAKVAFNAPYANFLGRDSARNTPNGQVVFQRGGAPVARAFVRPQQPGNFLQSASKYMLSAAAKNWTSVNPDTQQEWDDLGQTITRTTPAGFTVHPSGRALWIESSIIGFRNNLTHDVTPPASLTFLPIPTPFDLQRDSIPDELLVFWNGTFTSGLFIIYLCGPLSLGVRSLKGRPFFNATNAFTGTAFSDASVVDLTGGPSDFQILANVLAKPMQDGQRWGVRFVPLAVEALITGTPTEAIIDVHGP